MAKQNNPATFPSQDAPLFIASEHATHSVDRRYSQVGDILLEGAARNRSGIPLCGAEVAGQLCHGPVNSSSIRILRVIVIVFSF